MITVKLSYLVDSVETVVDLAAYSATTVDGVGAGEDTCSVVIPKYVPLPASAEDALIRVTFHDDGDPPQDIERTYDLQSPSYDESASGITETTLTGFIHQDTLTSINRYAISSALENVILSGRLPDVSASDPYVRRVQPYLTTSYPSIVAYIESQTRAPVPRRFDEWVNVLEQLGLVVDTQDGEAPRIFTMNSTEGSTKLADLAVDDGSLGVAIADYRLTPTTLDPDYGSVDCVIEYIPNAVNQTYRRPIYTQRFSETSATGATRSGEIVQAAELYSSYEGAAIGSVTEYERRLRECATLSFDAPGTYQIEPRMYLDAGDDDTRPEALTFWRHWIVRTITRNYDQDSAGHMMTVEATPAWAEPSAYLAGTY